MDSRIAGQSILRKVLSKAKDCVSPAWFSVIADEAMDVTSNEQLSLVIRWVSDSYNIHEDPVGLFQLPNTRAETLFTVIKDILVRCNLPYHYAWDKCTMVPLTCREKTQV